MELELRSTISRLRARSYALQQGSDNYKQLRRGWKSRSDNVLLEKGEWNSLDQVQEDTTYNPPKLGHIK